MTTSILFAVLSFVTSTLVGVASAQSAAPDVTTGGSSTVMTSGAQPHPDGPSTGDTPLTKPAGGGSPGSGPGTRLGPVLPEDIKLIGSLIPPNALTDWLASERVRFFGWAEGGYTTSSTGGGLLEIEPRMNRFGNSWLFNQATFVLERTLAPDWSWGFRSEFYMGADAAYLRPLNGFGPTGDKFGTDFRQAYVSIHAPVLTEAGVDVKLGRQYVPIGYETTMAPYRPMYSLSYAWNYTENGATTGAIAMAHVNPSLDVIVGVTLGANSLYEVEGRAPCYIARGLYYANKQTKLVATMYTGPEPVRPAKGHLGRWETLSELQLVHDLNARLTLVSDTNLGWYTNDPANDSDTSQWYDTMGIVIVHVHPMVDVNFRAEWLYDADGAHTGTRAHYFEVTPGLNIMPTPWLNFRPEVRWDGSTDPVFGPDTKTSRTSNQVTFAVDGLLKF